MQQIGDDGKQRCFLPAMLRRAGTEGRANLSIQRSACPKTSGLVQKGGHLRRYPAIARTCADGDGVIVRKFLDSCYASFMIQLDMGFLYWMRTLQYSTNYCTARINST